ncbi:MAG: hypothetical protein KF901_29895 [Myxococcales bacterium]|nr:hypothetical protein [Myxococcales bacterium]
MPTRPLLALLLLAPLAACGDDDAPVDSGMDAPVEDAGVDAAPPMDWPAMRPETSTVPTDGVRRDVVLVPGFAPPANPETGEATPADLNFTQVLRYRRDVTPPAPARAIIVCMPGFLGGAGSFEGLARALVRLGVDGDAVEVWAIDRRSNLLEDLAGMDAAEVLGDPEIAQRYYFGRDTVGGEAFAGYVAQRDVGYMSEWGLETHVEDLRAVISRVPAGERRARVFLLGHSLGASFTEAYAAWRFDDDGASVRGVDELAGLVLVDGALGGEPTTEEEYLEGTSAGPFPSPGLGGVRTGMNRYTSLPLFGIDVYARAEVASLRALVDPEGVVADPGRDRLLGILSGLTTRQVPALTNAAGLAYAFDDELQPLGFVRAKVGRLTGGPIESYESALAGGATLQRPTDPDGTYGWQDAPEVGEFTSVRALAESFVHGRSNFAEWYFPTRLPLDLSAVGGARVPEDGWQASYGLRAFDGALVDAPILAIANALVGDATRYEAIRDRVASAIGEGRPHAGTTRDDALAFQIVDAVEMEHLDPVLADETVAGNPVPAAVIDFVRAHVAEGTVALTLP